MKRPGSAVVVAFAVLAACETEPDPPEPAPVLHGIETTYGVASGMNGELTLGEPVIDGPLGADALRRVFGERGHELEYCYQRTLDSSPTPPRGHLLLAFTVTSTGAVARPVSLAEDTLGDAGLAECVALTVGGWTFTAPTRDVQVRYPIDLSFDPLPPG